jgi:hypothetical protein
MNKVENEYPDLFIILKDQLNKEIASAKEQIRILELKIFHLNIEKTQ